MLWFVGIGIGGYRGISLRAVDVLKNCDFVFAEGFTSALGDNDLKGIRSLVGKEVTRVQRWFVEDGRELLEAAKTGNVALVTYGDPLVATTHNELRCRAAKSSIETSVIHASTGVYSAAGEAGLHVYKLGRIVTIMSEPQSAVSVYNTVFENLLSGDHTIILTEYRSDGIGEPFFLDPPSVFRMLMDVEAEQGYRVFSPETFAVVASRIGDASQKIVSGRITSLSPLDFGSGPHTIMIPGSLHFTEIEALRALAHPLDEPQGNSDSIVKIASQMIARYGPKARVAVQQMREFVRAEKKVEESNGVFEVLDNAEYYISDAERFLNQGRPELAVLSIGYAEGLVDALRFQKGINPWLPLG